MAKVRGNKETGRDTVQAINEQDKPFNLKQLLAAMKRAHMEEASTATPNEGLVLEIIKRPANGVSHGSTYALSYLEVALILEQHSEGAYGNNKKGLDALVMAAEAIAETGNASAKEK